MANRASSVVVPITAALKRKNSPKRRALIAVEDVGKATQIATSLRAAGFNIETVHTEEETLDRILETEYNVVVIAQEIGARDAVDIVRICRALEVSAGRGDRLVPFVLVSQKPDPGAAGREFASVAVWPVQAGAVGAMARDAASGPGRKR